MKRLAVTLVMSAWAAQAVAESEAFERPYLGVDYQLGTVSASSGSDAEVSAVRVHVGTEITRGLGVEVHGAAGIDGEKLTGPGIASDVELDSFYGVFLRPQLALGETVTAYALVGYSYVDVNRTTTGGTCTTPCKTGGFNDGASFGAGIGVKVYDNISVRGDYVQYIEDYSGLSVGVSFMLD